MQKDISKRFVGGMSLVQNFANGVIVFPSNLSLAEAGHWAPRALGSIIGCQGLSSFGLQIA